MNQFRLCNDIRWLFARGGEGKFIRTKDLTYRNLILKFLSALHVEVTHSPGCQEGYISFYLQAELYELKLDDLNDVFGFLSSLDFP